ncbi:unnamed protein product [Protopolystoma xenopodis]|uniref:Uncharacterized protein n=1 Tax=Protopolystoma xenopodis TaxID=117903 RepID=A0A448WR92_9PLAT|nr:unnamed protein product [Protopolystoma xenopodis]
MFAPPPYAGRPKARHTSFMFETPDATQYASKITHVKMRLTDVLRHHLSSNTRESVLRYATNCCKHASRPALTSPLMYSGMGRFSHEVRGLKVGSATLPPRTHPRLVRAAAFPFGPHILLIDCARLWTLVFRLLAGFRDVRQYGSTGLDDCLLVHTHFKALLSTLV